MRILLFTKSSTDKIRLPKKVKERLNVEHISFDTTDLDKLLKVAKYRIINFPTSLVIDDNDKILLKIRGSIPGEYADNLLR